MDIKIREMTKEDKSEILEMMEVFYHSPAVETDGSAEIYEADVEACIGESPYLEGYVFEYDSQLQGYAMVAKSFSTEYGKPCIWVEDLYIKPQCQGMGIGRKALTFIENRFPGTLLRLEVETENESAVHLYKKCGFTEMPYTEMKKEA